MYSMGEGDIMKVNPLYQEYDMSEGSGDYDSICSYKQMGQFFPHHPSMGQNDTQYEEIGPLKLQHIQDDELDDSDAIKLINN